MITVTVITVIKDLTQSAEIVQRILSCTDYPSVNIVVKQGKPNGSLAGLYNEAAEAVNSDVLVFVHEDVYFKNPQWLQKITNHLEEQPNTVIGVAGTKVYTKLAGTWPSLSEFTREDVYQGDIHYYVNPENLAYDRVQVLDGCFLACLASVWQQLKFSNNLEGYHYYDIDFSLRAHNQGHFVTVLYGLGVEHMSSGRLNAAWVNATYTMRKQFSVSPVNSLLTNKHPAFHIIMHMKAAEFINAIFFSGYPWKPISFFMYFISVMKYLQFSELKLALRYLLFGGIYSRVNKLMVAQKQYSRGA